MTFLVNRPENFPSELAEGFLLANSRYVVPVFGGAVRATRSRPGKVALIVGGGTGHYPAFAGWVGQGMADGVVFGNIFSSPSAAQAVNVARAANQGGGVLIAFGNYAGDVLHFGQAAEMLRAEGIEADIAVVTDDVASAAPEEVHKRRGICGWVTVFKVTGAACETGASLAEVKRVFTHVNERTRTLGVAFSGCTLPGADGPLFTVPDGKMGVGLGVHGEPGIYDADLGSADDVAETLVGGLLKEAPDTGAGRVIALLNGLGSTTYEELFVTYRAVAAKLDAAGVEIVDCEVGELTTSLDMGGVSLSLTWTDEEIEEYWNAPCDTPALRRGTVQATGRVADLDRFSRPRELSVEQPGSVESQAAVRAIAGGLERIVQVLHEHQDELGRLDAVAGDGDHGVGMVRGAESALAAVQTLAAGGAGVRTALLGAGGQWSERAGGTSGALWGSICAAAGGALSDTEGVEPADQVRAARTALTALLDLGKAAPGDKTMIDACVPFVETLESEVAAGTPIAAAWRRAAEVAVTAAQQTAPMRPAIGRARPLAERSVGHPDPGAVSFGHVVQAIAELFHD